MYNLSEAYKTIGPDFQHELWKGRIACAISNPERTMLTNQLRDTLACYTFTLVRRGHLTMEAGGREITIHQGEMFIYLPGFPVHILSVSPIYEAIVLLVDEGMTYETSAFRNLIRASYYPLVQYGEPKLTLSPDDARLLDDDITAIRRHIVRPTPFTDEVLENLYSVFILDFVDIQEHSLHPNHISRRTEDLFISFYALLRQNYTQHHDIAFYADRLSITTTYLSRIVRQVTGRTVVEYINQMLAIEATWLLTSSSLTIAQIAERLCFASSASFDKFFTRMQGRSPSSYRRK
ncbi:MAG: helix-turn-helix transcriptional regulator [Bacteroidaceae bacterium]|nr:helix-turn-helix transcriptional regulator [Bacteroidaceae bacterium]